MAHKMSTHSHPPASPAAPIAMTVDDAPELDPELDPFYSDDAPILGFTDAQVEVEMADDEVADASLYPPTTTTLASAAGPMVLAAFYGRVSTDQQDLRTQVAWGERYAIERGFFIPPALRFLDEDRSGRLPLVDREAGKALWNLLHGPGYRFPDGRVLPVKHVLVSVFDRWGRRPDDAVRNVEHFHAMGVKIHFADVPQYNPDDPTCVLLLRTRATFAEFEVGVIRQRIRAKLAQKRARHEVCGHLAYGWRVVPAEAGSSQPAREEPDPVEQGWISHMQRRRAEGWGFHRIARELNAHGVPTKIPAGTLRTVRGPRRPDGSEGPPVTRPVSGKWDEGNVRNVLRTAERRAALASTPHQP